MAALFKKKNFVEKYRVFGSAFFEAQNGEYNLEKSDKLVLPAKALQKLTEAGFDFPMTLRVTPISTEVEIENSHENDAEHDKAKDSDNGKNSAKKRTKVVDLTQQQFDFNDSNGRSLILANVVDFAAPDGLVWMSDWMLKKLGFAESGQSIVELEGVAPILGINRSSGKLNVSNLMCYPLVDYVEFQPFLSRLFECKDMPALVKKTLDMYYSSLRQGDVVTVEYNEGFYELEVITIRGKFVHQVPGVVVIGDSTQYAVGFRKAKDYESRIVSANARGNQGRIEKEKEKEEEKEHRKGGDGADNEDKHDEDEDASSSDEDWEVVKIGPIKSIDCPLPSEVSELEPDVSYDKIASVDRGNNGNDSNDNSNDSNKGKKGNDSGTGSDSNGNEHDDSDNGRKDGDVDVPSKVVAKPEDDGTWQCAGAKCGELNQKIMKFCPKCGMSQTRARNKHKHNNENKNKNGNKRQRPQKKVNPMSHCLKEIGKLSSSKYEPGESRSTGWELKNVSKQLVKVAAKLVRIEGNNDENSGLSVNYQTPCDIHVESNENYFFVIDVQAPVIAGKYDQIYQLCDYNDETCILCPKLVISYHVNSVFSAKKERLIKDIYNMGFKDRKKIVNTAKRHKWNMQNTINELIAE